MSGPAVSGPAVSGPAVSATAGAPTAGVAGLTAIPGDPVALKILAARLSAVAERLGGAGLGGAGLPADPAWSGVAADAFRAALAIETDRIRAGADAMSVAASTLARYADDLAGAQAQLARAAVAADPARLPMIAEQARGTASAAARRAAATIGALARSAPPPTSRAMGWVDRLSQWQVELGLGTVESVQGLAGLVTRFDALRVLTDPAGLRQDVHDLGAGLAATAAHPGRLWRTLVDADTWQSNPARALGHLAPDLAAAAATGGIAAASRRTAVTAAAQARRAQLAASAAQARHDFVQRLAAPPRPTGSAGWQGEGGLHLAPALEARVEALWAASAPFEPALTARIRELAAQVDARLEGLEHRLKGLDSLKRKVATQSGEPAAAVLEDLGDAVRYTLVLPERRYTHGVRQVAAGLDQADLALTHLRNTWSGRRYKAVNSTWTDPRNGVRFEVQFHTPATWLATVRTHPWYETYRLPDTPAQVKLALEARIAREYAAAAVPRAVAGVSEQTVPGIPAIRWPVAPAAAAGTATAGLGWAADRHRG